MGCTPTKEQKYVSLDHVKEPPPSYAETDLPSQDALEETLAGKIELYWKFVGVNETKALQISSHLRPYLNIGSSDPLSSAQVVKCMNDALQIGLSKHRVEKCAETGQPQVVHSF